MEEFKNWCTEHELSPDTVKALADKGFDSYKTVSTLEEKRIKQHFEKVLLPGQLYMLMQGVSMLRPDTPAQEAPQERVRGPRIAPDDQQDPQDQPGDSQTAENRLANGQTLSAPDVLQLLQTNRALGNTFAEPGSSKVASAASGETCAIQDPYQFGQGSYSTKGEVCCSQAWPGVKKAPQ